jgi:hypothetical protein
MFSRNTPELPQRAPARERSAKSLHPASVDTEIGVAETRCRADRNDILGGPQVEFEVVDEPEQQASTLDVKVFRGLLHDLSTRQLRYGLPDALPGLGRRCSELKRQDLVVSVARVA